MNNMKNVYRFDLYNDINRLSYLKRVDDIADKNPYKFMDYGLANGIGTELQNVYKFETKKQDLHYQPKIFRPPNTYYDGKKSYLSEGINNRLVDVSGSLYHINSIPLRVHPSVRQY